MMAELVKRLAHSVETTAVYISVRNVLADVFIVSHVSLSDIHHILCIGLRYVVMRVVDALISQ